MKPVSVLLLLFACVAISHQQNLPSIPDRFFHCICMAASFCNNNVGCDPDPYSCGPYQITEAFWIDASQFAGRKLGGDWKTCTTGDDNDACSRQTMTNYFARYGKYCTGGKTPTLQDYARIHYGGPLGCRKPNTLDYWKKVKNCLDN